VWLVRAAVDPAAVVRTDDPGFTAWLAAVAEGTPAAPLVAGLFGPRRQLFKRAASFDALRQPEVHAALAGRRYDDMVAVSSRLAARLSPHIGRAIDPHLLLVDAPPVEREVEFRLQVRERPDRGNAAAPRWRRLEDVSPVVRSLAHEQFDNLVKRVRIFAEPDVAAAIAHCDGLEAMLVEAAHGD
jgi:hypothetical protein